MSEAARANFCSQILPAEGKRETIQLKPFELGTHATRRTYHRVMLLDIIGYGLLTDDLKFVVLGGVQSILGAGFSKLRCKRHPKIAPFEPRVRATLLSRNPDLEFYILLLSNKA